MGNPILSMLNTAKSMPQNLGMMKQMLNMMRSSGNPQAMMSQLVSQNPQMKQVMDIVNRNGGDPQKVFYDTCKQRNINPDDILSMLK